MSASSEKRCLYEVLGIHRDCTADEIRTAYKRLALQRHPDKLVQSGLSQSEATAQFQELVNAYEVLSDPRERAWYDSHRSQILFSDPSSANSVPNSVIPNLYSFFSNSVYSGYTDTGKGFYKVYSDVFNKVYANEINFAQKLGLGLQNIREAPLMGNLDSPYTQVTAFYNYWLGFCTVLDFCWVDQYDAMAGPNRKSRRVMEEENKKLRKKAKREYNEAVRGLAEFVKKRDKRVVDMMVKRNLEMEKKREEERERKKRLERERMEKVSAYEEPKWSRIEEEEFVNGIEEVDEEEEEKKNELYCVVCSKKFKSEKQWKNHEQSKKHKEKVAELRESFADEDEYQEVDDGDERENVEEYEVGHIKGLDGDNVSGDDFVPVEDEVDKIEKQFGESVSVEEGGIADEIETSDEEEDVIHNVNHKVKNVKEASYSLGVDDDDEMSVLEAMVSGHKNRRNAASRREHKASSAKITVENNIEELDFMEYDNRKSTRRNRAARKDRGNNKNEAGNRPEETNGHDNNLHMEESSSHSFAENESNGKGHDESAESQKNSSLSFVENDSKGDDQSAKSQKNVSQPVDKKGATKKDTSTRSKSSAKGKKAKGTAKNPCNACGTCGEEFDSRNKLHKHLGDTGHATLKSR